MQPPRARRSRRARGINSESEPLLNDTTQLADDFEGGGRCARVTLWAAIVFAVLALVALILLGKVFLDDARVRALESEQENKRNQEAILRLLNEMGNLADGDLTVQASVTEDVTGAIADSINFTIEELRTLVQGHQLGDRPGDEGDAGRAGDLEPPVRGVAAAEQGNPAGVGVGAADGAVDQRGVADRGAVAHASRSSRWPPPKRAAQAVQNQIAGMNEIRTQIQDTSKRIKRLGESSLEIGEIVELISDITEQTNVLALNAAIQAASAGEAGRGFTVVAEEVQRLAERSGEATKQIEAIVKTIQADTQDAVAAMEKSTVGVVEGTKLSDAAGQALDGDPAGVARARRADRRHLGADAEAVGVGVGRDARHAGHPQDHRGDHRGHEADQRVDRPADASSRRSCAARSRASRSERARDRARSA